MRSGSDFQHAAVGRRRRERARRPSLPAGRGRAGRRGGERVRGRARAARASTLRALAPCGAAPRPPPATSASRSSASGSGCSRPTRHAALPPARGGRRRATLRRATHSWLARRRLRAATAIGELRLAEGARDLDRLLRDRDPRVRLAAARALGRIGDARGGAAPDRRARAGPPARAAAGGGARRRRGRRRPLLLAFRAPRTVALRVPLADALGRTGRRQAVEAFAAAMPAAATELRIRMVRALAPDRLARRRRRGARARCRTRTGGCAPRRPGRSRGWATPTATALLEHGLRRRRAVGAGQLHRRAAPARATEKRASPGRRLARLLDPQCLFGDRHVAGCGSRARRRRRPRARRSRRPRPARTPARRRCATGTPASSCASGRCRPGRGRRRRSRS